MDDTGRDPWPDPLDGPADHPEPTSVPPASSPGGAVTDRPRAEADRRRIGTWLVVGTAVVAVVARVVLTQSGVVRTVTLGSGLFFVLVPGVLALLLVRRRPPATAMGRAMSGTTFGLLLLAMLLNEGAVCVLLAAPLVYAATALVVQASKLLREGGVLALAVLAVVSVAPAGDGLTDVVVVRDVPMAAVDVHQRVLAGPDLSTPERPWLLTLGYPVPEQVERTERDGAVDWHFPYGHGGTTFRMHGTPDGYRFDVLDDTAMRRWFRWHDATLAVEQVGPTTTRVTLHARVDPALGPDWWFGTIEGLVLEAAGEHLLHALDLEAAR